ncbi:MAG TPA: lasso peptide biosynthesis B2 protein [Thermoanaerobaculia bacterium]|jgi:hypothetical protein
MRRLRVLRAALYLLIAKLALGGGGLARIRRSAIQRLPRRRPHDVARAQRIAGELQSAVRRVPFSTNCLDRAMALWWLLDRANLGATLRIGVRTGEAFAAHAWIEHAGTVLLDDGAPGFTPFDAPVLLSE